MHSPSFPCPCPLLFSLLLSASSWIISVFTTQQGHSHIPHNSSPTAPILISCPQGPFLRILILRAERTFVAEVGLELVIQRCWPFPLRDDQNVVEEKQVVAPVAESPPDAELFAEERQLAALLQPPWRGDQRKRLQGHRRGFTCTSAQLATSGAGFCPGAYLDFAKLHLFLDGVHLLRPLHPPGPIITTVDQLLKQ